MSADTLSEVLRAVRLTGAVFFDIQASAPWVAETAPARDVGPHMMPGVEHVIEYHVITSGSCWAGIPGETPLRLEAGDIIVFPQGDAHVLSSEPGMRGDPYGFPKNAYTRNLPIALSVGAGSNDKAHVVCGFLGCDARPFNPLLSALPRVLHVRRTDTDGAHVHFVELAITESAAQRPGGNTVLARLSELLFIEVVRRYIATLPPENVGWLAGLRDEGIGRVLASLHARPTHEWSLDELAREGGMSRSVLAERFAHFVGVPPMQYLTQWRMQLTATLLSTTTLSLAEIAEQVGYGSETALSRAYKRWVGVAPADWRRGKRSDTPPEP
jgi:AraC-like DNA-binding protein